MPISRIVRDIGQAKIIYFNHDVLIRILKDTIRKVKPSQNENNLLWITKNSGTNRFIKTTKTNRIKRSCCCLVHSPAFSQLPEDSRLSDTDETPDLRSADTQDNAAWTEYGCSGRHPERPSSSNLLCYTIISPSASGRTLQSPILQKSHGSSSRVLQVNSLN